MTSLRTSHVVVGALLASSLLGCATDMPDGVSDDESSTISDGKADGLGFEPGSLEATAVLVVANRSSRTELLDEAGLAPRVADAILAHRAGRDGALGTADDDRTFETLEELDAVKWVGPLVAQALLSYALDADLYHWGAPALLVPLVDTRHQLITNLHGEDYGFHAAPEFLKLTGDELGRATYQYWIDHVAALSTEIGNVDGVATDIKLLADVPFTDLWFTRDNAAMAVPCWTGDGARIGYVLDGLTQSSEAPAKTLLSKSFTVAAIRWNGEEWGETEIDELGFAVPANWNDHGNDEDEVEILWTNPNHDQTKATLIHKCTGSLAPGPVG